MNSKFVAMCRSFGLGWDGTPTAKAADTLRLGAIASLLFMATANCGGSLGDDGEGRAGANGGPQTRCSLTRCEGERRQCIAWLNLDREDCGDDCSGHFDILGCLNACHEYAQALVASRCTPRFEACKETEKANECWDTVELEGECSGASEIACPLVGDYSACTTVPGCEPRGSYIEILDRTDWSCAGEPVACSTATSAESCRALRCNWR
jgi:hypothetical protein